MTSLSIDKGINIFDVLHKTEAFFLSLITILFGTNLMLSFVWDRPVAWDTYVVGGFACLGLIAVGAYMRFVKGAERRAKITIAIAVTALLWMMTAILFHLHMPRPEPIMSDFLLNIDHFFGYDWPSAVAWVSEIPSLGWALRVVYLTSFYQILAVMFMLTYLNRLRQLDAMVCSNIIALLMVYAIWQLFPNLSQSTYFSIPTETALKVNLVTNSKYGAMLLDHAQNGVAVVSLEETLGAVAFPSYHMVMSALVVWFAYRTVLFIPILILNIVMMPAILIHGAHHIADVVGGGLILLVALVPTYAIVNHLHRGPAFRHRPA